MSGVSVVICTYNGSSRLRKVMDCLLIQDVSKGFPWEVIVVDNASTDDTREVALKAWPSQSLVSYRVISEPKLGLAFARIRGLENSAYELVGFLDDDVWVYSNWVRLASEIMASYPRVGACGGLNEAVFDGKPPRWYKRFQVSYGMGAQGKEGDITWDKGYVFGDGMIIRKKAWVQMREVFNGFFPRCVGRLGSRLTLGEDNEICYAIRLLGWQIRYDPRLKLKPFVPQSRLKEDYLFEVQANYGKATVALDPYLLAGRLKPALFSGWKRQWVYQVFLTFGKVLFFTLVFGLLIMFANARLEAFLRMVRHTNRLRELFEKKAEYNPSMWEIRRRLRKINVSDSLLS